MSEEQFTHVPVKRYVRLLRIYLQPQWRATTLLLLSLLLGLGLQLGGPQILSSFIDSASLHGASSSLIFSGLLFILVTLINQGNNVAISYLSTNIAWIATNQLREDLIAHCLSLDMRFHVAHTPGEMIERIDGDTNSLTNFFSQFILQLLTNVLLQLGVLVLFFTIDWIIGAVMLVFSLAVFTILYALQRRSLPLWMAERQMSATFYGFLGERLEGIEDIHVNDATSHTLHRFLLLVRTWFPIRKKASLMGNVMWITMLFLFQFASVLVLSLALGLSLSLGTIYLLFAYTDLLLQPIEQIQMQLEDWQQAEACIARIEHLFSLTPSRADGNKRLPFPMHAPTVFFSNVTFTYDTQKPAIRNLTLRIPSGRVLGIVGRTGSGKTTIARLLTRLYDPQDGIIVINGVPLQDLQREELRRNIGMVTQEVRLFQATVRDNLTLFNPAFPDARIIAAIQEVGLGHWYGMLSSGLDTLLKPGEGGLSAGEAQLLALARTFLNDARLVILDEATSRLDSATEALIEAAISKLLIGRTAIVIAHRLSTIQRADDIAIIEDGLLVEYGQRTQLAQNPHSRFVSLLQADIQRKQTC